MTRCNVRWGVSGQGVHDCKLEKDHKEGHECPHGTARSPAYRWNAQLSMMGEEVDVE